MKNYLHDGATCELIAPAGGVVSGGGYMIGSLFAVAINDAAAAAVFEGQTEGVFSLTKTNAQAWLQGDPIYWNEATKILDNDPATGPLIGVATDAAANPSATGNVKLNKAIDDLRTEGPQPPIADVDLTLNAGAAGNGVTQAITDPAAAPGTATILRDDLFNNALPAIRNNIADVGKKLNDVLAALRQRGVILP
jgi:predicted RecA/RadA family phage recombinase